MIQKLKKCFLCITLLLLSIVAGCISIKKEGELFVLDFKSISPAATPRQVPSTAIHYDMSTEQPTPLNTPPSQFKNKTNLTWTAPTLNTDGTPLHNLTGYKIYYGQKENSLSAKGRMRINVTKNTTGISVYNLSSGKWCFQVTAYVTSSGESEFSNGFCMNTP